MARIERGISINAPAAEVFGYLADFSRHSEWASHRLSIEMAPDGKAGAGATFSSTGHMMGKDRKDKVTVKEFVPNERIVYEADGDTGLWRNAFQLREQGGVTELTKIAEPLKPSFMDRLMMPLLFGVIGPRISKNDLRRIKAKVESGSR